MLSLNHNDPATKVSAEIFNFGLKLLLCTVFRQKLKKKILKFRLLRRNLDEIQNLGTGVCRWDYAGWNKITELSNCKTIGVDRLGGFLKIKKKLNLFFSRLYLKKFIWTKKLRNCILVM